MSKVSPLGNTGPVCASGAGAVVIARAAVALAAVAFTAVALTRPDADADALLLMVRVRLASPDALAVSTEEGASELATGEAGIGDACCQYEEAKERRQEKGMSALVHARPSCEKTLTALAGGRTAVDGRSALGEGVCAACVRGF